MRNPIMQALPPGATIVLKIDPPIADDEKAYFLTVFGQESVIVENVSPEYIKISNPTSELAPFMFFVGPRVSIPAAWLRFLGGL